MARISFSDVQETPFGQLLGHNPDILKAWRDCEKIVYNAGTLSPELKEQVRRALSFGNGCEYCQVGGKPNEQHPDPKESLAMAFTDLFLRDHLAIEDDAFNVLKEEFSDAEISELLAFICFVSASQRFSAVLQLEKELAPV